VSVATEPTAPPGPLAPGGPAVPTPLGAAAQRVAVLGIRHHGPGSARSVLAELNRLQPGIVLIEGPADADPLLALSADPDMEPPVALLAYAVGARRISAFWPFAVFSPEWQALRWAAAHQVPARFCDLPSSMVLADLDDEEGGGQREDRDTAEDDPAGGGDPAGDKAGGGDAGGDEGSGDEGSGDEGSGDDAGGDQVPNAADPASLRDDPIGRLASAAGYDDPERWWDDVIEARMDGQPPFAALTEAMAELRAHPPEARQPEARQAQVRQEREDRREERREAHMRQVLRGALKETAGTVAVVCGAWHAPALAGKLPSASADAALLRGVARRKTALTWVPWTHSRLATASGYGAGVTSPGWYHHLFTAPDHTVTRWLTKVAGALRARDLPVSSAHVIEAVRLADALAALRGRPLAGLAEVSEATWAVLCHGDDVAAEFVSRDLVVGERLGTVPDGILAVPLEADLRAQARRLRLKIDPLARTIALDLRKDTDRDRSVLLHRLAILGIGWGAMTEDTVRSTGTFRETWTLQWRPELAVAIIDAALWGTTVALAAQAKITDRARRARNLAAVTAAVEHVLLADLPGALPAVLTALDEKAARDLDVTRLMAALPALVRAHRYGDVRGTDTAALAAVADALIIRICAGLPAAVSSLAGDAAGVLRTRLDAVHAAVALHAQQEAGRLARDRWVTVLTGLADRRDLHGLLAGRVVRILVDSRALAREESARRFAAHLSVGPTAADKAAWAEGFLSGGGLLLVHDRELLAVLDTWVTSLGERDFLDVLPLLRRTFGGFSAAERANLSTAVRQLAAGPANTASGLEPADERRAAAVLATVATILGGPR
jgi:hypothetical protein